MEKEKVLLKSNSNGEVLWSMRSNIMYALFDYGRLMIDDEKKLQAFHNEIANICNKAYERVVNKVKNGEKEEFAVSNRFGYLEPHTNYSVDYKNLYNDLCELMNFVYGADEKYSGKVSGFLNRAQKIINTQYDLHYKSVQGGNSSN